ncbi:expressed unknown protein [Ectocarpus siliculosus]|uniref:Uncharacterized protein n=1 Tax=Ectocarpus siliculosus TaxID=2880 RepID=D7G2T3_ECTSI|nr:expressed unknown protein [Ectocarpus siliculosus]|eukprot:CBJ33437.1 expressed unknown protein [Ectocarpus siliculosus]
MDKTTSSATGLPSFTRLLCFNCGEDTTGNGSAFESAFGSDIKKIRGQARTNELRLRKTRRQLEQKHDDDTDISGDGQAAFEALNLNYNKVTDEVIRATMEELINTPMETGQTPDVYFNQKHLLRHKAEEMGKTILDRSFRDICVTGFTDEEKNVKMIMYRDPDFKVDKMQTTMRLMFLDE